MTLDANTPMEDLTREDLLAILLDLCEQCGWKVCDFTPLSWAIDALKDQSLAARDYNERRHRYFKNDKWYPPRGFGDIAEEVQKEQKPSRHPLTGEIEPWEQDMDYTYPPEETKRWDELTAENNKLQKQSLAAWHKIEELQDELASLQGLTDKRIQRVAASIMKGMA